MLRHAGILALLLCLLSFTLASLVNYTIDDTLGDSRTQQLPMYFPATGDVWEGILCYGSTIRPNPSKAFEGTYTAATYRYQSMQNASIIMEFEGIAIYVLFILPNRQGPNADTTTMVNFTVDGQIIGNFTHTADLSIDDILYNQTVFGMTGLSNGIHQLVISASDLDINVYINFDYAIYTHVDDADVSSSASSSTDPTPLPMYSTSSVAGSNASESDSSSRSTPVGAVVGGTIGGVILIGGMLAFFLWKRQSRRKDQDDITPYKPSMHQRSTATVLSPFLVHKPRGPGVLPEINDDPTLPNPRPLPSGGPPAPVSKLRSGELESLPEETRPVDHVGPESQLPVAHEAASGIGSIAKNTQHMPGETVARERRGDRDDSNAVLEQLQDMQAQITELLRSQLGAQRVLNERQLPGYTP
ncbi:hypothetical protein BDQ17DRAFT_1419092 [Cyathus striatus]|nr:hypothetical protein BDQ17DRAFT_1419092 [Cyathus striatus]